jgi:hypothetical protein
MLAAMGLARGGPCGCVALGFKAQAVVKCARLLAGRGPPVSFTHPYIYPSMLHVVPGVLHSLEGETVVLLDRFILLITITAEDR